MNQNKIMKKFQEALEKESSKLTKEDEKELRADYIIQGLIDRGASYDDAIAIAANFGHESKRTYSPKEKQDFGRGKRYKRGESFSEEWWWNPKWNPAIHGRGTGLAQWDGSRRHDLKKFAEEQGKSVYDMDAQLDFATKELSTTYNVAQKAMDEANTIKGKVRAFAEEFEKAGEPHMSKRMKEVNYLKKVDEGNIYRLPKKLTGEVKRKSILEEIRHRIKNES